MGITGLLPYIKNSCRNANVRDFSGATVAIDAYSWLHKGAFSCADKLVKGEKTDGYVFYCMKLLNMLLDCGVKPIMVFDGCNLPSKEGTERKRRENREKTKQKGKEFLCQGKLREARECFQRCVDVTPEMAHEVIEACRKKSIDCIVAPYEADAQLAYLAKINMVQIIITEDSDLILFGCERILFKMDGCGGGLLYEKENLPKSLGAVAERFSFEKFRYMCILSGCDYLPSLHGIGLAKAYKFFSLTNNPDIFNVLCKLPNYLKKPKLVVSAEYRESFVKANKTFLYQLVFCPHKKTLVPLNPYPEGMDHTEMEYAGKYLSDDLALQLAVGNINVNTLKRFSEFDSHKTPDDLLINSCKSTLWSSGDIHSTVKTDLSAFKHSNKVTKANNCFQKKRNFEQTSATDVEAIAEEDELFSMYAEKSPDAKHQKLNESRSSLEFSEEHEDISERTKDNLNVSSLLPFGRQSKTPLQFNKSISKLSVKKIVRSRFFADGSKAKEEAKNVLPEKLSLLETIDNELQRVTSTLSSERKFTKILSPRNRKANLEDNVTDDESLKKSEICISPKKLGKENIVHGFAKKKFESFKWTKDQILSAYKPDDSFLTKSCSGDEEVETFANSAKKKNQDVLLSYADECSTVASKETCISPLNETRDKEISKLDDLCISPKTLDKQSIVHRFAKKKKDNFKWSRPSSFVRKTDDLNDDDKILNSVAEKESENLSCGQSLKVDNCDFELVLDIDFPKPTIDKISTSSSQTNAKNIEDESYLNFSLDSSDEQIDDPSYEGELVPKTAANNSYKEDDDFGPVFPNKSEAATPSNISIDDDDISSSEHSLCATNESLNSTIDTISHESDKKLQILPKTDTPISRSTRLSLSNSLQSHKLRTNYLFGSDGSSFDEGFESEGIEKGTPTKRTSIFFQPLRSSCESSSPSDNVVLISSDSEDFVSETSGNFKEKDNSDLFKKFNAQVSSKDVFSKSFKTPSNNNSGKMSKCRSIGLSKKRLPDKKVNRKETLLNFNFVRQPRNEVVVLH